MDFQFLRKIGTNSGLCCLYLMSDKLFLTHLTYSSTQQRNVIQFVESVPYQNDNLKNVLSELVADHKLQDMSCSWVLNPNAYHLLLLDPPKVEAHEMKDALRWKIKDLINFPPEDTIIDFMKIPSLYKEKLYVVASSKTVLKPTSEKILSAGLKLNYIDIPELAFRNITTLYNHEDQYCGLLVINHDSAALIVTRKNDILLSQRIPLPYQFNIEQPTEQFAAEIQNGFFYCNNQQKVELPKTLLIGSNSDQAAAALQAMLGFSVKALHLETKIDLSALKTTDFCSREYLTVIGGACRE